MTEVTAKYSYFDVKGIGEAGRMLLSLCKIKFEDHRVEIYGSEWPELKKDVPMNQLPLLEIDGMRIFQSKAICRYLARKIDLDGNDDRERVYIDMAADIIYDLLMKMRVLREIDNETAKDKKFNDFKKTVIPKYLGTLDDMIKNGGGYLCNGKLSWVDVYLTGMHDALSKMVCFNIGEAYPNIQKLMDTVNALPDLQEYLKFRPVTEF